MNVPLIHSIASVGALGLALVPFWFPSLRPQPINANCRMSVWLKTESPPTYETACIGNCADQGDLCDHKTQLIAGTTYYYCKCTQAGTPVEPDSTACTTVVTENNGAWSFYCYNQACETYCDDFPVRWEPSTPCLCH